MLRKGTVGERGRKCIGRILSKRTLWHGTLRIRVRRRGPAKHGRDARRKAARTILLFRDPRRRGQDLGGREGILNVLLGLEKLFRVAFRADRDLLVLVRRCPPRTGLVEVFRAHGGGEVCDLSTEGTLEHGRLDNYRHYALVVIAVRARREK